LVKNILFFNFIILVRGVFRPIINLENILLSPFALNWVKKERGGLAELEGKDSAAIGVIFNIPAGNHKVSED
jgi:hypothetical protein